MPQALYNNKNNKKNKKIENKNKNMFIFVADLKAKNKESKVWQMFIFCHFWLWHECCCLYVISLIIYDRKSHATGPL